jgi:hypothetical protein
MLGLLFLLSVIKLARADYILDVGSLYHGTCNISLRTIVADRQIPMLMVRCVSTLSRTKTTCMQGMTVDQDAFLHYQWRNTLCSGYLLENIYPQIEQILVAHGIISIGIRDSSTIYPLNNANLIVPTVLYLSMFTDTPSSFFHHLGFQNMAPDQARLNFAFETLRNYTCGEFARDVASLDLSNGIHNDAIPHIFLHHHSTLLITIARETSQNILGYMYRKIKDLGSSQSSPMFMVLLSNERIMNKRIREPREVVANEPIIVSDDESLEGQRSKRVRIN